jgi:hypothetical protein
MIGGARTNGCSEQKAEDGRSFHRSGDGAITFCCGAMMLAQSGRAEAYSPMSGFGGEADSTSATA